LKPVIYLQWIAPSASLTERHTDGGYVTVPAGLANTILIRLEELFELLKNLRQLRSLFSHFADYLAESKVRLTRNLDGGHRIQ